MTTSPKLNTIHEPVRRDVRVRTRSLQVAGNIPIDGAFDPDDEVAQYNRSLQQYGTVGRRYTTTSPGPYNRSLSPQSYLTQQPSQSRLARMQSLARSEEQLHKPQVMVEYLRPVGILTGNQSPPPRPGSAQAHRSRDNSQESVGHVTRINIEEKEDRERSDSRTRRKSSRENKEDSRSRERSDSRKKSSSKSRDHDKKKKKKKRSRSRKRSRSKSASSASSSGSSGSDSGSDSESESDSGSESDSKDRKHRKKSRKSRKSDDRKRKESKSKHRKKSKRHRDDSSPEKKNRKKSEKRSDRDRDRDRDRKSSSKRNEEVVTATMETNTSPTRAEQRGASYDTAQDYMQRLPYDNPVVQVVQDDPRNYYSTSTLPSNASLRKPSGILVPLQQPHTHTRAPSEPRVLSKKMSSNTLDRYTLMAANAQRSKSADRLPMKYRRVSMDPGYHQGYPQQPQKLRSVSMATHEAGDLHVLSNPAQSYRYT